jgi:hypothetical protein
MIASMRPLRNQDGASIITPVSIPAIVRDAFRCNGGAADRFIWCPGRAGEIANH